MKPNDIRSAGESLFGNKGWIKPMARALMVSPSTVRHWLMTGPHSRKISGPAIAMIELMTWLMYHSPRLWKRWLNEVLADPHDQGELPL